MNERSLFKQVERIACSNSPQMAASIPGRNEVIEKGMRLLEHDVFSVNSQWHPVRKKFVSKHPYIIF